MTLPRLVACAPAFGAALLSTTLIGLADESPGMPLMRLVVGHWQCSYHGDDGSSTSTESNRIVNSFWMATSIEHSARPGHFPAHHHDVLTTYDATRRMWILIHTGSRGSYGIEKSYSSPDARSQRWITEYPPQKVDDGYTIVNLSRDRIVRRQYWTETGRPQTSTEICLRQLP